MKRQKNNLSILSVKGGITVASGFAAAGMYAGIKKERKPDLGIVHSSLPCTAAGVFTTNAVKAACIHWNQSLLPSKKIHAVCCNSGNANACTGSRGDKDVRGTASQVASHLKCKKESVIIASTGVIGNFLPMDLIEQAIPRLTASLAATKGKQFATAIMTTDTKPKEYAVEVTFENGTAHIGGCAKGAGMTHPNMATMLCFITTDLSISPDFLDKTLRRIVSLTFNNLTVDGDTSTNDMVVVLANGSSGVSVASKQDRQLFEEALFEVCNELCARIAADGEGATKRIEITVTGGKTYNDCKLAAKAVANSNLVKTAIFGNDPNWGRILCAVGYSGAQFSPEGLTVSLCGIPVFKNMRPAAFAVKRLQKLLRKKIVAIDIDLGYKSKHRAIAQTCDFSYDYVRINAEYHT